jgi:hypothetical protein
MNMSSFIRVLLIIAVSVVCAVADSAPTPTRPSDEFGDINCESEMARLDNFAIQLQNEPRYRGEIIFFAGNMAGDRLPKRGEAEARVERIRLYLTKRRGIPPASLVVINGGYSTHFRVVLWSVPPDAGLVKPEDASGLKEIRYSKTKLNPRDYQCRV